MFLLQSLGTGIHASRGQKNGSARTSRSAPLPLTSRVALPSAFLRRRSPDPILPAFYRAAAVALRAFSRGGPAAASAGARAALRDCAARDPDAAAGLLAHVERVSGYTPEQLRAVADDLDRCARLAEAPAPAAVASRADPVRIDPRARRSAPAKPERRTLAGPIADDAALHLGRDGAGWPEIVCGKSVNEIDAWTDIREAFNADANPCPACRAADDAEGAAPDHAAELHYVRDYHTTVCGGPLGGASRATGSPQVWHAEPPATRCEACAAELRKADPHRFDTRLQGITDTSGDADELLSREPPFAGRGGSL